MIIIIFFLICNNVKLKVALKNRNIFLNNTLIIIKI